jgi:peptidoglycan/LPS O-acetylase OafA/YrhL
MRGTANAPTATPAVRAAPAASIPRSLSVYLDLLRFSAAMAVFIGHILSNEHWIGVPYYDVTFQEDAVTWFFVLSGMVIGYVSMEKERSLTVFMISRLARLWSVALPALLLTPVLDAIGHSVDSSVYFFPRASFDQTLHDAGISALFLNYVRTWAVVPGSNTPYWSLSYEFAYYVLFGLAFYVRGWLRPVALLAVALLVGQRILLLFPIWLLGLAAWHARRAVPARFGWALLVGSLLIYLLLAVSGAGPGFGRIVDATLLADRWLGWSKLAGWKYVLGLLVTMNILGFAALSERISFGRCAPAIRAVAGMTFTLYIFHYPLLSFFSAVLPGPPPGLARCIEIGVLTLLSVAAIAQVTERQKEPLRRWLDRAWSHMVRAPA